MMMTTTTTRCWHDTHSKAAATAVDVVCGILFNMWHFWMCATYGEPHLLRPKGSCLWVWPPHLNAAFTHTPPPPVSSNSLIPLAWHGDAKWNYQVWSLQNVSNNNINVLMAVSDDVWTRLDWAEEEYIRRMLRGSLTRRSLVGNFTHKFKL